MQLPGLNLTPIPVQRKVRSDTDLQQFILADRNDLEVSASQWVREVATEALSQALRAGNPSTYVTEIDGKTSAGGGARRGAGFRAGPISAARTSVRVSFIGNALADIANGLRPILAAIIAETFPSGTGRLAREWAWYVQRDRLAGKNGPAQRLGSSVPDTIGIYDVLWLVPESPRPAAYAWFANRLAIRTHGHRYNLTTSKKHGTRLRKRLRGYLAEATRRMRGANKRSGGITVQGFFVQRALTASASRSRFGVPAIRVAFRSGLTRPVSV